MKRRSVTFIEAAQNFERLYRGSHPSGWTDFQLRHLIHMLRWGSLNHKLRRPAALPKQLLINDLGQKGYLKHIKLVYCVTQGCNVAVRRTRADDGTYFEHESSTYDYRNHLKRIEGWMAELGDDALEYYRMIVEHTVKLLEHKGIRAWWWFMEIKNRIFKAAIEKLKQQSALRRAELEKVTTILTIQDSIPIVNAATSLARGAHSVEKNRKPKSLRARWKELISSTKKLSRSAFAGAPTSSFAP